MLGKRMKVTVGSWPTFCHGRELDRELNYFGRELVGLLRLAYFVRPTVGSWPISQLIRLIIITPNRFRPAKKCGLAQIAHIVIH